MMMAERRKVSNLLALGVLSVLMAGRPMYPYEMANLLRRTGKERDLNIKWGSFYTVVRNLEKHGFIVATGSDRERGRPERTSYTLTGAGQAELRDWLRELVAEPEAENPRFGAALSVRRRARAGRGGRPAVPSGWPRSMLVTRPSRPSWPGRPYPGSSWSRPSTPSRCDGPRPTGSAMCSMRSRPAPCPDWRCGDALTRPVRCPPNGPLYSKGSDRSRPRMTPARCANTATGVRTSHPIPRDGTWPRGGTATIAGFSSHGSAHP